MTEEDRCRVLKPSDLIAAFPLAFSWSQLEATAHIALLKAFYMALTKAY
jgi:hypothetical protein